VTAIIVPNGVPALEAAPYIVLRSMAKESWQGAAGRRQKTTRNYELGTRHRGATRRRGKKGKKNKRQVG